MFNREQAWALAMRAALEGDEATYAGLLRDIADVMRAAVHSKLSARGFSTSDTEDIVQEILIGLHTKRHTWDQNRPILPWVNAIVRYKIVDAVRQVNRRGHSRSSVTIEDLADILPAPAWNHDNRFIDVEGHLAELPKREREVIRNIALKGESIQATADLFAMSEGAVRVAFHRGLRRIGMKGVPK